ncbi:MAG: pentapeptide repeat-containing protein [Jatrophihabitantaceae bacterium]
MLLLAVFVLPNVIVRPPQQLSSLPASDRVQSLLSLAQTRNAVRTSLIQAVGGALVLLTLAASIGQLLVARQGQLVDRFTKTIDQLGNDSVDVQLGGVFALQQIARRPDYARPAAEILRAYLKIHASDPASTTQASVVGTEHSPGDGARGAAVRLRPNLQAALRILVKDGLWDKSAMGVLDLSFIDVQVADLAGADLSAVVLLGARLQGSNLRNCRLNGADLRQASLDRADLRGADLSGADGTRASLKEANLDKAKLTAATFEAADLSNATMLRAGLQDTDFTDATLSGVKAGGSTLIRTVLIGTNLDKIDLADSTLRDIRFDPVSSPVGANLTGALTDEDTMSWLSGS